MTTQELAAVICRNWYGLDDPMHSHPETISSITRLIDTHIAEREAAQTRVNQALIDGCNRMLANGAQGTTADLEEYVALREAALVERIIAEGGFQGFMADYLRKAARRPA